MPRDLLPLVREKLGARFEVEREIGRGGAAIVFLATDRTGRRVALKVLRPELAISVAAERFLREIELVDRLDHPRISKVLESGEREWLVYYTMPYWEGPSLVEYLAKYGSVTPDDALRVGRDLLEALDHAHGHGVIHRDVKPDNIILHSEGTVLLDFGIARAIAASEQSRLTKSGIAIGTSAYMSPEQVAGLRELDHRSDLYSLACVLFECRAGRPPFVHRSESWVLQCHMKEPPPPLLTLSPTTPEPYARAVDRGLAKVPEERWQAAREMLAALTGAA